MTVPVTCPAARGAGSAEPSAAFARAIAASADNCSPSARPRHHASSSAAARAASISRSIRRRSASSRW